MFEVVLQKKMTSTYCRVRNNFASRVTMVAVEYVVNAPLVVLRGPSADASLPRRRKRKLLNNNG